MPDLLSNLRTALKHIKKKLIAVRIGGHHDAPLAKIKLQRNLMKIF